MQSLSCCTFDDKNDCDLILPMVIRVTFVRQMSGDMTSLIDDRMRGPLANTSATNRMCNCLTDAYEFTRLDAASVCVGQ